MNPYQVNDFIYGVDKRNSIFEVNDFFIGMIIDTEPLTCLILHSAFSIKRSDTLSSEEFARAVRDFRLTGDREPLDTHYERFTFVMDTTDMNISRFLHPTKEGYTKAFQEMFKLSSSSIEEAHRDSLPYGLFAQRFLSPHFSPINPKLSL